MLGGRAWPLLVSFGEEVVTELNVKLECVPSSAIWATHLGAGGGVDEAARARVRCAWAKFKELSPILTACGASPHEREDF